jgi:hypothetical protein
MKRFLFSLPVALSIGLALFPGRGLAGVEENGDAKAAGQALAARLRSAEPVEDSEVSGSLVIKRRRGEPVMEIPITCKVFARSNAWDSVYETGATAQVGAQKLVVEHRANGPSVYRYGAAAAGSTVAPELRPVEADRLDTPLAGSDFSIGELGLEFLFWADQTRLKGEMRLGEPCYVLESRDASGNRIRSWIDKESVEQNAPGLMVVEAYDAANRLVKEFTLGHGSFKKVNGRWQLKQMKIRSVQQKSETVLKFNLADDK